MGAGPSSRSGRPDRPANSALATLDLDSLSKPRHHRRLTYRREPSTVDCSTVGCHLSFGRRTRELPAAFEFDSAAHDAGSKVVLGHLLPAGRGTADGEDVLDILARHPSTAHFIARKLAIRFVSDTPPEALVERAAQTYLRTDGDIREVLRTIVTSPEFLSPDVYGVKVKSPLEFVLSMRRALSAPVDTAA